MLKWCFDRLGSSPEKKKYFKIDSNDCSEFLTFRYKYDENVFDRSRDYFSLDHATLLNLIPEYLSQIDFKLITQSKSKT